MARQGISKEMYLQISGRPRRSSPIEAEPEAEKTLRREAVIAAVVEAEKIEPTDDEVLEALEPTAERNKTTPQKLFKQLDSNGRLDRTRERARQPPGRRVAGRAGQADQRRTVRRRASSCGLPSRRRGGRIGL